MEGLPLLCGASVLLVSIFAFSPHHYQLMSGPLRSNLCQTDSIIVEDFSKIDLMFKLYYGLVKLYKTNLCDDIKQIRCHINEYGLSFRVWFLLRLLPLVLSGIFFLATVTRQNH